MIAQMERMKKAMKGGAVSSMAVARMRALKSRMTDKDIRERMKGMAEGAMRGMMSGALSDQDVQRMKKSHKSMEYEK